MRNISSFILKFVGTLFLIVFISAIFFFCFFLHYIVADVMTRDDVNIVLSEIPVNLSSSVYYKDSETGEYVEWYTLQSTENRIWVDYDEIPKQFEHAFVSIEDERFYTHHGVDWKRTIAAALNMVTGDSVFGGSTITQQLIKNLTDDTAVTINRKLREICRAIKLEENYSKETIMEWYLNIIYFGRGQYGIGAAAKYYFGEEVDALNLAEMCCIAGITNNPSLYDPYQFPENNKERQEIILGKMLELGYIDDETYQEEKARPLEFVQSHSKMTTTVYPYYVDAVIEDVIQYFEDTEGVTRGEAEYMVFYGGYKIYTCVDMDIQMKMDSIYQDLSQIPSTRDDQQLQSSMVIMDPYTGDIVGMEGGVGPKTTARGLNWASGTLSRRPPGSSIKPISVYGPAIDKGLITPNTQFLDAPDVKLKGTAWYPKNSNRKNYGVVTIRKAVTSSLNTIAAQVMDLLSPAASYQFLTEKLHMTLEPTDKDYAPLAAGQLTYGTTVREMASAYSIFPTGGIYRGGRTFSRIEDNDGNLVFENKSISERAISDAAAYWVTDMLEDVVDYGTGTAANLTNMTCAGKTGTTTDTKDMWFIGFTPYYIGAVWTGYENPATIHASPNPAARIWKSVMSLVHEGLADKKFTAPENTSLKEIPGYTGSEGSEDVPNEDEDTSPPSQDDSSEEDIPTPNPEIPLPDTPTYQPPYQNWYGPSWQNPYQSWPTIPQTGQNWYDQYWQ